MPITASVSPCRTLRSRPRSTGSEATYPKVTSSNSMSSASCGSSLAPSLSWMSGFESMTSKTRIALARTCWPKVISVASMRTGPTNEAR